MSVLNVLCPACSEMFANGEDIYSSSCGHVFHAQCMREWQSRSNSCPQCHEYAPSTHKLYLSFDENTAETTKELRDCLEKSSQEIRELNLKLYDRNILLVHDRCDSEKEIGDLNKLVVSLKSKLVCLEGSHLKQRQQIFSLTQELADLETHSEAAVAKLRKEIDVLKTDLENISTEFAIEVSKNVHLSADGMQPQAALSEDNIEALEHKLEHLSADLEKEVAKSAQLHREKMKLQNYIDSMAANSSKLQNYIDSMTDNSSGSVGRRDIRQEQSETSSLSESADTNHSILVSSYEVVNAREETRQNDDSSSTIIQNHPSLNLLSPVENTLTLMMHASKWGITAAKGFFQNVLGLKPENDNCQHE